jgi:hypothetical protein
MPLIAYRRRVRVGAAGDVCHGELACGLRRRWWWAILIVLVDRRSRRCPSVLRSQIETRASEALHAKVAVGDVDLELLARRRRARTT